MNKNIFGVILLFGLVSTIALFLGIVLWAFNNDYVLYELNVQAEGLKNSSLISQSDLNHLESAGNEHATFNFHFDEFWLASALVMFVSTIAIAYFSREEGLFSFLGMLFFGTMIFLFALGIVQQVTDYVLQDIFYKMLPSIEGTMPMYEFYMDNIGIISFAHLLVCILVNRFYFKLKEFTKKSDIVMSDTEII
jgi:hypothetical protein